MKARLLHLERDFQRAGPLPPNTGALCADLGLGRLLDAMARGDDLVRDICQRALLNGLDDPAAITYRQGVLADCLACPELFRDIYELTSAVLYEASRIWRGDLPGSRLSSSVREFELVIPVLRRLRDIATEYTAQVSSVGLRSFLEMLIAELGDDYLTELESHLATLRFRHGVLISARLKKGVKGGSYILHRFVEDRRSWARRVLDRDAGRYSFQVHPMDQAGAKALGELRTRGIALVANAMSRSADHIRAFLAMVQTEVAFYLGCANLASALSARGHEICFPEVLSAGSGALSARGLYEPCLALVSKDPIVPNDIEADGRPLVVITGANQGGKSTFLRALALAQLMAQAGMFVAATSYRTELCSALFTHFRREEDPTMHSGKLDEELTRMSEIADLISPGSLVCFNESFAATNEREGSEIARQVIGALLESGVKVIVVTHFFDLADSLRRSLGESAAFLRAERAPDGGRTFRLLVAPPLATSFGADVFREIFGFELPEHPAMNGSATRPRAS